MKQRTPEVLIGERRIGDDHPAYVIAEAGVNHDGRVDDALRMVAAAAGGGADAVKFQVFRAEELATESAPAAEYQRRSGATSQRDMLRRLELTDDDFARLCDKCHNYGIEFLATPFGPSDLRRLIALGVHAVKLASADLNNTPLLTAAAETKLPLIVSTGAATADEIETALIHLERLGTRDRLVLMHCVSRYPTPVEEANLAAIATLRATYGVVVGFSDHTRSIHTGGWAAAAGARVLEKHFTLDRSRPGPDHAASLEPDELRAYVAQVRAAQAALGRGRLGMSAGEADVRAAARKSATAARDIAAGEAFSDTNVTLKRPGGGIPPGDLAPLLGRRAARAIARHDAYLGHGAMTPAKSEPRHHRQGSGVRTSRRLKPAARASRRLKPAARLAVVTGTRAEFGLLESTLRALRASQAVDLQIVAAGMHLLRKFGATAGDIRRAGWPVAARVRMQAGDDHPLDQALGLSRGVAGIARFLHQARIDAVLVLGDRIEALAAALAAVTTGCTLAHVHGGDVAPGDFDEPIRDAITKLADVHFTATRRAALRLIRMGEDPQRVFQVGAPGLDRIYELLAESPPVSTTGRYGLVIYHAWGRPASVERRTATEILNAVAAVGLRRCVVYPNSDRGHEGVIRAIEQHQRRHPAEVEVFRSLPRDAYLHQLMAADVLVGNSSSGIIEAPAAGTPSVNVGGRQAGRERGGRLVLDALESVDAVAAALKAALRSRPDRRRRRVGRRTVYGDGGAGARIAEHLIRITCE